jgi:hypothetical protein
MTETKVSHCTRVSVECHPYILFECMLDNDSEQDLVWQDLSEMGMVALVKNTTVGWKLSLQCS